MLDHCALRKANNFDRKMTTFAFDQHIIFKILVLIYIAFLDILNLVISMTIINDKIE